MLRFRIFKQYDVIDSSLWGSLWRCPCPVFSCRQVVWYRGWGDVPVGQWYKLLMLGPSAKHNGYKYSLVHTRGHRMLDGAFVPQ